MSYSDLIAENIKERQKKFLRELSIEQAQSLYRESGIATVINDGDSIMFQREELWENNFVIYAKKKLKKVKK